MNILNRALESADKMRPFLLLTLTQAFSALGSAMTGFALVIWSYQQQGSALNTAMLSVATYAPYVVMSIFAGAISDRWDKKRVMLVCDALAAVTTVYVLALLEMGNLEIWHLYMINAVNGLMNTVQRPAADVAVTLLTPKDCYQQASAVQSAANSVVNLLTPVCATAVLTLFGLRAVILIDLITFAAAFSVLLLWIRIPPVEKSENEKESMLSAAGAGLRYLRAHPGILHLIFFLAGINLIASVYNAALPAMILSVPGGGESALALQSTVTGLSMLAGSVLAAAMPKPRSRVKVIVVTLFISMSTENFFLAFGRSPLIWAVGAVLGWLVIPVMNANLSSVMRECIPVEMQGRVYSARNTLQFFTIPLGYFLGGWLIDAVFEPAMAAANHPVLAFLFGTGKGSGASALYAVIALCGVAICCMFARDRHIWALEKQMNNR